MNTSFMHGLRRSLLALFLAPWLMLSGPALAHKASDSYLTLDVQGQALTGQWDIALRDIDFALGLDLDGNGELTWGEVRGKHPAIAAWALKALKADRGGACEMAVTTHLIDDHVDGAYAVLKLQGQCPSAQGPLTVDYGLLFEEDALHRGLLRLSLDGHEHGGVFSPDRTRQRFEPQAASVWQVFQQYVVEGVWHIWIGFDHILFLLALLLPSVLVWQQGRWSSQPRLRQTLREVLAVVTAFTLAHSITLTLAALEIVSLPSRLVESTIAASVVLAAANNLRPMVTGRLWLVAFGFGLIHGFGFASVLADLGLPPSALVTALLGFNVGVELGQLAIVAAFLPVAWVLRRTPLYRRVIFQGGSVLTLLLAAAWFTERAFDLQLMP